MKILQVSKVVSGLPQAYSTVTICHSYSHVSQSLRKLLLDNTRYFLSSASLERITVADVITQSDL